MPAVCLHASVGRAGGGIERSRKPPRGGIPARSRPFARNGKKLKKEKGGNKSERSHAFARKGPCRGGKKTRRKLGNEQMSKTEAGNLEGTLQGLEKGV